MRRIRFAALAMALVLVVLALCACNSTPKVTTTCTLSIYGTDNDPIIMNYKVEMTHKEGEPPSVLDAAVYALQTFEITFDLDENNEGEATNLLSVTTKEGVTYKAGNAGEGRYQYWDYTADGAAPEAGTGGPAQHDLIDGQTIVFTFSVYDLAEEEAAG